MATKSVPDGVREYFSEIKRLFSFEAAQYHPPALQVIVDHTVEISKRIESALKAPDSKIIVVVGPWGSGKTTQLRKFKDDEKENYTFVERQFYGAQTFQEGLFHLVPPWKRIAATLVASSVAALAGSLLWNPLIKILLIFFSGPVLDLFFAVFGLFIGVFIFSNRVKLLYLLAGLLDIEFWFSQKRHVWILEDLDRSSMPFNDQWALLFQLRRWRRKYIVAYGFKDNEERLRVFERATKLEAVIIELPVSPSVNHKIATAFWKDFPFTAAQWLGLFTPRELDSIINRGRSRSPQGSSHFRLQANVVREFQSELSKRLLPPGFDASSFSWSLDGGPKMTAPSGAKLTGSEERLLKSFGRSIDPNLMKQIEGTALPAEKNSANWRDVLLQRVMNGDQDDAVSRL